MNSAQVAFLDFVQPRCCTLALSWNELSSGSLKGSSLQISGLSLFSENSSSSSLNWSLSRGQKWWTHSLGRELKKKSFYHQPYLRIVWICFIYLGNRLERLCHHFFGIFEFLNTFNDRVFNVLGPVHFHVGLTFNDLSSKIFFCECAFFLRPPSFSVE